MEVGASLLIGGEVGESLRGSYSHLWPEEFAQLRADIVGRA